VYAQCAARQERFWEFHDRLLAEQAAWRSLLEPSLIFRKMARELKLDMKALEDCVNSAQVRNAILLEKAEGESRFVKSTPTYFLNGEMIVGTKSLQERLRSYFP